MDAQAGLPLYCSQIPEDKFSRDEVHIRVINGSAVINLVRLNIANPFMRAQMVISVSNFGP